MRSAKEAAFVFEKLLDGLLMRRSRWIN